MGEEAVVLECPALLDIYEMLSFAVAAEHACRELRTDADGSRLQVAHA